MTEHGIVVNTDGRFANVKVKRHSACGHDCGECRLCNIPDREIKVINPVGAKAGDTVVIGASSARILHIAFIIYILPIIGAAAVGAVSAMIFESKLVTVLSVAAWIVLWIIYIRHLSRRFAETSEILEVVYEKN